MIWFWKYVNILQKWDLFIRNTKIMIIVDFSIKKNVANLPNMP